MAGGAWRMVLLSVFLRLAQQHRCLPDILRAEHTKHILRQHHLMDCLRAGLHLVRHGASQRQDFWRLRLQCLALDWNILTHLRHHDALPLHPILPDFSRTVAMQRNRCGDDLPCCDQRGGDVVSKAERIGSRPGQFGFVNRGCDYAVSGMQDYPDNSWGQQLRAAKEATFFPLYWYAFVLSADWSSLQGSCLIAL